MLNDDDTSLFFSFCFPVLVTSPALTAAVAAAGVAAVVAIAVAGAMGDGARQ